MTDPVTPADGRDTDNQARPITRQQITMNQSRRRFINALTSGGILGLAGCSQPDSSTSSTTSTVSSKQFRAPTRNDPAKTSFFMGGGLLKRSAYAAIAKAPVSYRLRRFLMESGLWISGNFVPSPKTSIQYNWIKRPIEISSNEVTLRIRDEAKWSDGHPITGKDIIYVPLARTLGQFNSPPQYAPKAEDKPSRALFAFDDFQIRDKSVTYKNSQGYFSNFWDISYALHFGQLLFPPFYPTHMAPFDAYADGVIKTARKAQAGEIYPWWDKGYTRDPDLTTIKRKYLTRSEYVEKYSKPENVLSTGPWDLVKMRGKEFIFEPNPHHRHADAINFETFRFEYTESSNRERTALKADRLDYGSPGLTPKSVVDAFPNHIEVVRIPGGGNELAVNFDHSALGTVEVRQALMYALDQSTIARNIHQSATIPVTTPGGDSWKATEYVSQDWIAEHLITYKQNHDRAAKLMRAAGYTRNHNQWIGEDGDPLTLTLPTPNSPPKWEPTVASQLSEFGIDTTVRTLDETMFRDRRDKGKFAIWPSGGSLSGVASGILNIWFIGTIKDGFMIYPDEQYDTGEFSDNGVPIPRTEDRYGVFTIQAPPIGQPNGPLQAHPTGIWGISVYTNPSREEFRRRVERSLWVANWFLPTIPLNKQYSQRFIDTGHWDWPTDSMSWKSFVSGDLRPMVEVLRHWGLQANPNNPEASADGE